MYKLMNGIENAEVSVLVVDDDPQQRKLQQSILDETGYQIIEAVNGEDALSIIKHKDIDVVLLDRYMPGLDGDEICRKIREEERNYLLPVIMVTGDDSPLALTTTLNGYANDFIKKPYRPEELIARVNSLVSTKRLTDQLESVESVLYSLARMVEAKDKNTGHHCMRLANICEIFGMELGLTCAELEALRRGSILHDIGKIGIPDSILLKPGPLTSSEKQIMEQHTIIGYELCRDLKTLKTTLPIIRNHHENFDGSGYPDKLSGSDIPLLARVFQIADIYDALSTRRSYKNEYSTEQVIGIFEEEVEKGWRDPDLVYDFIMLIKGNSEKLNHINNSNNFVEKHTLESLSVIQGSMSTFAST